MIDMYKNMDH